MGSGCISTQAGAGCGNILSSNCIRYEGAAIPLLGICTGDNITEVQNSIIEKLLALSQGTGINLEDVTIENCVYLFDRFSAKKKTLQSLFQLLIDSYCDLKKETDLLKNILATAGNNISYDLKCVDKPGGEIKTESILQAVIDTLCVLSGKVGSLTQSSGNTTVINSVLNQALGSLITSPGGNGYKKMVADNGQISYSLLSFPPPGAVILYSGPLNNFDNTGKGLSGTVMEGWFICNGANGTIDMRGFIPVGIIQGAAGAALDPIVDPVSNKDTTMNYSMGQAGGKAKVALDISQLPAHSHPVTDPGHSHDYSFPASDSFSGSKFNSAKTENPPNRQTSKAVTGISIGATGGGSAHENRMPYRAVAYIMRFS